MSHSKCCCIPTLNMDVVEPVTIFKLTVVICRPVLLLLEVFFSLPIDYSCFVISFQGLQLSSVKHTKRSNQWELSSDLYGVKGRVCLYIPLRVTWIAPRLVLLLLAGKGLCGELCMLCSRTDRGCFSVLSKVYQQEQPSNERPCYMIADAQK